MADNLNLSKKDFSVSPTSKTCNEQQLADELQNIRVAVSSTSLSSAPKQRLEVRLAEARRL